ncbi:MAG: toxin-antitoxin system HicB family antitoxin [Lentisphaerae bacterium]|jgi:hypothetical protein|nr:toxin-antitoxin system HicB family antitoxin [Lentisphaerota bacterium]MBT5612871.1 toxin-antitoxin system HicB family antitoxin [Lentisphaerota bacterium]MBT7056254.1 toxin-antitoxin system HicB family antitoxin [Lentisphaerota bacterium]MBT7847229.1 toxin-antitoxin system HicB family antitoxin [Lentisphaerota bacterium]
MSTISVRMPNSLHNRLRELSKQEHASINQLVTLAVAEKLSALETMDYLKERAARTSREKFDKVMAKVPDVEPPEYDRLPDDSC